MADETVFKFVFREESEAAPAAVPARPAQDAAPVRPPVRPVRDAVQPQQQSQGANVVDALGGLRGIPFIGNIAGQLQGVLAQAMQAREAVSQLFSRPAASVAASVPGASPVAVPPVPVAAMQPPPLPTAPPPLPAASAAASGGSAAAAAGPLAGMAAAAGPVGLALAGVTIALVAATKAIDKLREIDQKILETGQRLAPYSPALTVAQAQSEIRLELARLRMAQQSGPSLARYAEARSSLDLQVERLQTSLSSLMAKYLQPGVTALDALTRLVAGIAESADRGFTKLGDLLTQKIAGSLDEIAGYFAELAPGVSDAFKRLAEWFRKQDDVKGGDIFGIFFGEFDDDIFGRNPKLPQMADDPAGQQRPPIDDPLGIAGLEFA